MRVAVLAKQVPSPSELRLSGGQLVRTDVPLETSAYCRRANARAVELAGANGDADGEVVVFTMGPPAAEAVLREMIACGANRGVLLSDPRLAGSDTLATSRALAAAIELEGPFDLVLCGAFSLDSETGQVGPQIAHLLRLPFVGPCRELDIDGSTVTAKVEVDGGYQTATTVLPVVAAAAERLCSPSKGAVEEAAAVPDEAISRRSIEDLRLTGAEVGQPGSPTWVGEVRGAGPSATQSRARAIHHDVGQFVEALHELLVRSGDPETGPVGQSAAKMRADSTARESIWCVPDSVNSAADAGFVAACAELANQTGRRTVVMMHDRGRDGVPRTCWDETVWIGGEDGAPEHVAATLAPVLAKERPHAVIIEATSWGRELAARIAVANGWGLVGDAVAVSVESGDLIAWKSAFSGQAVVSIGSESPSLVVTVKPGILTSGTTTPEHPEPAATTLQLPHASRVTYGPLEGRDPDERALMAARTVIAVGQGVYPDEYQQLEPLRQLIGAGPLGATRRVTDLGWLPRSRQIGITGKSVSPNLLVSIGASGRFNHTAGFSRCGAIAAINQDANAAIFDVCDIGLVGDWRVRVPEICLRLATLDDADERLNAS